MAVEQEDISQHQEAKAISPFTYRSPFERCHLNTFEESERYMTYQGTVGLVLDELVVALASPQEYFAQIALHPPRLIRAAMDWTINHPNSNSEPLILNAIQTGLAIYQQRLEAVTLVQDFRRMVATRPDMLTAAIKHKAEYISWEASDPGRSYESARKLAFELEGQDILLIALGHGGTAAGMDVFLRYADIATSPNSAFYVIRFSRRKMQDRLPQISKVETAYLRELALRRQIVIFDEDSATHATLDGAIDYFRAEMFSNRDITECVNLISGEDCYKDVFQNLSNFKPKDLLY